MRPREINPRCNVPECIHYEKGRCTILNDTNFGQRGCPFRKERRDERKKDPVGSGEAGR